MTALLTCAFLFALLTFVVAIARPDTSFDGNFYHIPPISLWARVGYIHWIHVDSMPEHVEKLINGYPKGVELAAFVVAQAFGTSRLIPAVTFCFLPLGVCAIAQLATALGARLLTAYACAAVLLLVPVVVQQSAATYTDASYACCVAALFATACSRGARAGRSYFRYATLGAAIGLVTGVKASGFVPAAIVVATLFLVAAYRALRQRAGRVRALARVGVSFGLAGAVALAVGGYWYVRNYAHTGSPLYPVGLRIGAWQVFPGATIDQAIAAEPNTPPKLRTRSPAARVAYTWVQGGRRWPKSILPFDARLGGLGFTWILACVPAILAVAIHLLHRRRREGPSRHLRLFGTLAFFTAATFLLTPLNWWARYTIWIYALGLPALAWLLDQPVHKRSVRIALRGWLGAWTVVMLFEAAYALHFVALHPDEVRAPIAGPEVAARLASLEPVALLTLETHFQELLGPLLLPIGQRQITFVRPNEAATADQHVLDRLRRADVRYILYERGLPLSPTLRSAVRAVIPSGPFDLLDLKEPPAPGDVAP